MLPGHKGSVLRGQANENSKTAGKLSLPGVHSFAGLVQPPLFICGLLFSPPPVQGGDPQCGHRHGSGQCHARRSGKYGSTAAGS